MPNSGNGINDRFLIKLSGETFAACDQDADTATLDLVGGELLHAWRERLRVAVVLGGGYFFRDRSATPGVIDRIHAAYVGMLVAVMNGIILQQWIQARHKGWLSIVRSVFPAGPMCNGYSPAEANGLLDSGSLVILAGGAG